MLLDDNKMMKGRLKIMHDNLSRCINRPLSERMHDKLYAYDKTDI